MRSIPSHTSRGRRWRWLLFQGFVVALVLAISGGSQLARAQAFTSGSNGSDGALSLTTPGDYVWDPSSTTLFGRQLDTDGDGIYHFTTITIASGVNIRMLATRSGTRPLQWLASGTVQIDGALDLSGQDGHQAGDAAVRFPSIPGPGGFPGGVGELGTSPGRRGGGPGGGGYVGTRRGQTTSAGAEPGGDGSHATRGQVFWENTGTGNESGDVYGSVILEPFLGGSGGGGAACCWSGNPAGGGGAGGGALLIASSTSITVSGTIVARGGARGIRPTGGFQQGGAGSGGSIRLMAPTVAGAGTLDARGGSDPRNAQTSVGGQGRIRLDAFGQNFTGSVNPTPFRGAPFEGFLTEGIPSVRVTTIGSAPIPQFPSASLAPADVNINSTAELTATIEARNVPVGTVVKLHLTPENAPDQTVDCSPLQGTLQQSTATCAITIPAGFSRMHTRVTW